MADSEIKVRHYWERHVDDDGKPTQVPGSDLAALRRGAGRDAGDVPQMWRYYTTLQQDGRRSWRLAAEHAALTLYAVHQQSKAKPMHVSGIGLGTAMRALRLNGKFSQDAVDRRFAAAATATSFDEICLHLRGLITQLRTIDQPLDYTRLYHDLVRWQRPEEIASVRRAWGSRYFATSTNGERKDGGPDRPTAKGGADDNRRTRTIPHQSKEPATINVSQESV